MERASAALPSRHATDRPVRRPIPAGGENQRSSTSAALLGAATVVVLLPVAIAAARATGSGWLPVGDNGLMYVRTRDVFSGDPPLLFMSALGCGSEDACNHPGPMLFYALAVPTAVLGRGGLAVGTAMLNGASIIGIALLARRLGGAVMGLSAMAVVATLGWSLGSELLFDPWSPNSLVLPFFLFLLLVWSVATGDLVMLPALAGVGSLLLQTNLSYGLVVPVLAAWAVVGLVLERRRGRSRPDAGRPTPRRVRTVVGLTGLVVAVLWFPPVLEQLTSDGRGNFVLIARESGNAGLALGVDDAVRLFAGVVALPRWWLRSSTSLVYASPPSFALALPALLVLGGLLLALAFDARRRLDRTAFVGIVTAMLLAVAGLVTLTRAPVDGFGRLSPYQTRLLWPLAAFVAFTMVTYGLRRLAPLDALRPAVVGLACISIVAMAALTIPRYRAPYGTHEPEWSLAATRRLSEATSSLEEEGTLFFAWEVDTFSYQFVAGGLLAELRRRGIPFVVDEPFLVRDFGEHRRFTGSNADVTVVMRSGDAALTTPPGARRVALLPGLGARERRELARLRERIARYIDDGRLRLTRKGQESLARLASDRGASPSQDAEGFSSEALLGPSRPLGTLLQEGYVVIDDGWAATFARYVDLQDRWDERTFGVFTIPL
jgi:hypothetical protein